MLRRIGGQCADGVRAGPALVMDRACEGDETRQLARDLGFIPMVPPLRIRRDPWTYDRQTCKRRNEIKRLFRRLKGFRRICSRFDKLDALFLGFIHFALIYDTLPGALIHTSDAIFRSFR